MKIYAIYPVTAWLLACFGGCSCSQLELPESAVAAPTVPTVTDDVTATRSKKANSSAALATSDTQAMPKEKGRSGVESTSPDASPSRKGFSRQTSNAIQNADRLARDGNHKEAYERLESVWSSMRAAGAPAHQLGALLSKMEEYGERLPPVSNPGKSKHWVVE